MTVFSFAREEFPVILLYHRVSDLDIDNQYLSVSPKNFESHLQILAEKYTIMSLPDMLAGFSRGRLPAKAVAITFDDGYADNLYAALPLLEKYTCPATVFVSSGMTGDRLGFWYDVLEDVLLRPAELPEKIHIEMLAEDFPLDTAEARWLCHESLLTAMHAAFRMRRALLYEILAALGHDPEKYVTPHPPLNIAELQQLAASPIITIGAHTLHHPVLARLSYDDQYKEIWEGALLLETYTGEKPQLFAYPFGDAASFNATSCDIVRKCGFAAGIANYQGSLRQTQDQWHFPRRLVRNWNQTDFDVWLANAHKNILETETLAMREKKIADILRRHSVQNKNSHYLIPMQHVAATEHPLYITHINTRMGRGGSAKIAELLLRAQNAAGHKSHALAKKSVFRDACVAVFDTNPDISMLLHVIHEGIPDYAYASHHMAELPEVRNADVLHIHNLHAKYFNPFALPVLAGRKPTIWTLHDMWAFTGHCAHSFGCERWRTGCGLCPNLNIEPVVDVDNTHRIWRDKKMLAEAAPLWIVTPSQWLASMLPQSLLAMHPVKVIPNGIDTERFCPMDKREAKQRLGLPEDVFIIGNAADDGPFNNPWKGGEIAWHILQAFRKQQKRVFFLGTGSREAARKRDMCLLPYTDSEEEMRIFYSALDCLLFPSLAENFPLTVLESLACGTPVLAFAVGGIPEIIQDGKNGFLVPANDEDAMLHAAFDLLEKTQILPDMGGAAREQIANKFDARLMAQRYESLYEQAIADFAERKRKMYPLQKSLIPVWLGLDYMKAAQASGVLETEHSTIPEISPNCLDELNCSTGTAPEDMTRQYEQHHEVADCCLINIFDTRIAEYNLGNAIIMDAVDHILDELFPDAFFVRHDCRNAPGQVSLDFLVHGTMTFLGGTNALSSHMQDYAQWDIASARDAVHNVILCGAGWWQYQDLPDTYTCDLLADVLHHTLYHSVRDSYTEIMLRRTGFQNVLNTGCPSMWNLTPEHCREIDCHKAESVLVTFTDYSRQPVMDAALLAFLRKMYKHLYLWVQGPSDMIYAQKLCPDFGKNPPYLEMVPPKLAALDTLLASKTDLEYVGTRLHAGIRALQYKRRATIIAIDNRAMEIHRDTGLPVVQRNDFAGLEKRLRSAIPIRITLPQQAIERWKSQFV